MYFWFGFLWVCLCLTLSDTEGCSKFSCGVLIEAEIPSGDIQRVLYDTGCQSLHLDVLAQLMGIQSIPLAFLHEMLLGRH